MIWYGLLVVLAIFWAFFAEWPGILSEKSRTGGWAARALFFVYLSCALLGIATVIRIALYGN
jgi:cytochrome b561